MAGNNLRCVAKYLYDNGMVRSEHMKIETASGIRKLKIFTRDGKVSSVTAEMGKADFSSCLRGSCGIFRKHDRLSDIRLR